MVKICYRYRGDQECRLFARFKGDEPGPNLSACVRPGFGLLGHYQRLGIYTPSCIVRAEGRQRNSEDIGAPEIGWLFTRSAGLRAAVHQSLRMPYPSGMIGEREWQGQT